MQAILPGGAEWVPLTVRGDERGSLIAIEQSDTIPFDVARAYYLYGTQPGVVRGLHAHRRFVQFAVPVRGSCTMLLDDGRNRVNLPLDDPALGLMLPPMVWHEMADFSAECVLLVLADAPYDEGDYIRDYDEFLSLIRS